MINVLSIIKIFACLIAVIVAIKGCQRWKKTKALSFKYFYQSMVSFAIATGLMALAGFIPQNPYLIQAILSTAEILCVVMFIYFLPLLAILLGFEKYHRIIFRLMIFLTILFAIIYGLGFDKAAVFTYPVFGLTGIGLAATAPGFIRIVWGLLASVFIFIVTPLFIKRALRLEDLLKRKKGIFFSLGILGLSLAIFGYCFVGPYLGYYSFWKELVQGLLCLSGQTIFALGMLIEK